MAKPNYAFEKRQKELKKKKKREEKLQRKQANAQPPAPETGNEVPQKPPEEATN